MPIRSTNSHSAASAYAAARNMPAPPKVAAPEAPQRKFSQPEKPDHSPFTPFYKWSVEKLDSWRHQAKRLNLPSQKPTVAQLKASHARLKEVPVYLVNSAPGDTPRAFKVHGFVALGTPGKKGAKVFSHGKDDRYNSVEIDKAFVNKINAAKHNFFGKKWGHRFSKDVRAAVKEMRDNPEIYGTSFRTIEDFHQSYRKARWTVYANWAEANKKDIESVSKADMAKLESAFTQEVRNMRGVFGDTGAELKRFTASGKDFGDAAKNQKAYGTDAPRAANQAEEDSRAFEKGATVSVRQVSGNVKATDVLEAAQEDLLKDAFINEKLGRAGLGVMPQYKNMQEDDLDFDDYFDTVEGYIEEIEADDTPYRGVEVKNDDFRKMIDVAKTMDERTRAGGGKQYHAKMTRLHEQSENVQKTRLSKDTLQSKTAKYRAALKGAGAENVAVKLFRVQADDDSTLANTGNCNSAARSLLERAAQIRAEKTAQETGAAAQPATTMGTMPTTSWAHGTDWKTERWTPVKSGD